MQVAASAVGPVPLLSPYIPSMPVLVDSMAVALPAFMGESRAQLMRSREFVHGQLTAEVCAGTLIAINPSSPVPMWEVSEAITTYTGHITAFRLAQCFCTQRAGIA